jgi:outer membrane receptor protein involved in Fe transport
MTSLDLGWEFRDVRIGRLALSAFVYEADQLIEFTIPDGQPLEQYNNVGGVTGKGVQAEWQRNWQSGWRVNANTTLQQVEDKQHQHRIDAPEQLAKLQLRTPKIFGVQPALEYNYMGSRMTRDQQSLPATSLINMTLSYALDRHHTLWLSAYNLTDVDYQAPVSFDYAMPTIRQYGRTLRLKWEWRY